MNESLIKPKYLVNYNTMNCLINNLIDCLNTYVSTQHNFIYGLPFLYFQLILFMANLFMTKHNSQL